MELSGPPPGRDDGAAVAALRVDRAALDAPLGQHRLGLACLGTDPLRPSGADFLTELAATLQPGGVVDDDVGLPSVRTQPRVDSPTSGAVSGATTTSTSSEAGTGLKKCMPRKRAGRYSAAASSVIDSEDVLVASTTSAPAPSPPR
ncbi:hypothetical protein SAMN05661080_01960 [Modestobacter sp. DSM 44400]|nr:hypothetical protein SAMN05661080_01960 [Modestobacter sp. DSM 44400]